MGKKIIFPEVRFLGGGAGLFEFRLLPLDLGHVAKHGDSVIVPESCSGRDSVIVPESCSGRERVLAPAYSHFEPKENRFGVIAAGDTGGAAPAQCGVDR